MRAFIVRNCKELMRDPLSYLFCLGFPLVMLGIMTVVNQGIPPQANMHVFDIDQLAAGIAVFSYSFSMLFTALLVSKDRASAFLLRLYASPLSATAYIVGYTVPVLLVAVAQTVITFAASMVIGAVTGIPLSPLRLLLALVSLLPMAVCYIAFGLFFGSLLSEKSAPGLSSVLITASALLGGVWMDVEAIGGGWLLACKLFPFYYGVKLGRIAVMGAGSGYWTSQGIVCLWMLVVLAAAVFTFRSRMKQDIR